MQREASISYSVSRGTVLVVPPGTLTAAGEVDLESIINSLDGLKTDANITININICSSVHGAASLNNYKE